MVLPWPGTRLDWLEWSLAAALLALAVVEIVGSRWAAPLIVSIAFAVPITLALPALRNRAVGAVTVILTGQTVYCAIWGTPQSTVLVLVIVWTAFGAGRYRGPQERLLLLGVVVAGGVAGARTDIQGVSDVLFPVGIALAPFAGGRLVAHRQRLADQLREQQPLIAHAAVVDERTRIARELHDVVAHSVSVMVIQSVAARRLLRRDADRADEALRSIESSGKEALGELRRLLGVLRTEEEGEGIALEPQPGLGDLDALVTRAGESGVQVALEISGDRASLTPGVNLAAYRIVQEALTNVIRHAGTDRAQVRVAHEPRAVVVEILDGGGGTGGRTDGHGSGHGLVGMRERVTLYGGELEAGPRDGGGYAVRARLPVDPPG